MLDNVTLDQMRVLIAISNTGSFTAASKRLQRAQSAISHAVAVLENQLELTIFDRSARKPTFTVAGKMILEEARFVVAHADRLRARAKSLSSGLESEVFLSASAVVPIPAITAVLVEFSQEFPTVNVQLFVEEFGGAAMLVRENTCNIGIVGAQSLSILERNEVEQRSIGSVDIVAVVAANHPLARHEGPITETELQNFRQLVPTSRAHVRYGNTLGFDAWQIADLSARYNLLVAGLGWGTVPSYMAHDDLVSGRLVKIDLSARSSEAMRVPIFAIFKASSPPGPAGQWIIEQLAHARF